MFGAYRMVDLIPMAEVENCKPYDPYSHLGQNVVPEGAGVFAMQIETSAEGHNSGLLVCSFVQSRNELREN